MALHLEMEKLLRGYSLLSLGEEMDLTPKNLEFLFVKMYEWVKRENYQGYDPYDWGISPMAKKLPYHLNLAMSQLNLYSPINLRKIFKIEKGTSNKSLALFAQAYLRYYEVTQDVKSLNETHTALSLLEKNAIKDNGIGWASYYFPFIRKKHTLLPQQVDIIATSEALKAYSLEYYISKDEKYKEMAEDIVRLIFSKFIGEYKDYKYIKYFPHERDKMVFNVSGLVLSAFSEYLNYVGGREDIIELGNELVKFLIAYQSDDGVWPYSYFIKDNRFHYQIDYHQGFILDGLVNFCSFIKGEEKCMEAIEKGVKYYKKRQFNPAGFSYYRIPRKYPIDIHNQAQGIITFSNLYEKLGHKEYLVFAEKIMEWTIRNMWSPEGYFYSHKWPIFINKIPYIRWAQAWMMVALAKFLRVRRNKNETGN